MVPTTRRRATAAWDRVADRGYRDGRLAASAPGYASSLTRFASAGKVRVKRTTKGLRSLFHLSASIMVLRVRRQRGSHAVSCWSTSRWSSEPNFHVPAVRGGVFTRCWTRGLRMSLLPFGVRTSDERRVATPANAVCRTKWIEVFFAFPRPRVRVFGPPRECGGTVASTNRIFLREVQLNRHTGRL